MKPFRSLQSGFSLIELLISIAIVGVIAIASVNLLRDATKTSSLVNTSAELQEELRLAAAIMSDEIERARYIFPPNGKFLEVNPSSKNVTIDWSDFDLGSSNLRTGWHGQTKFEVNNLNSDAKPQILAMITAPRNTNVPCLTADNSTTSISSAVYYQNSSQRIPSGAGCYQFVAYYPIKRVNATRGENGNDSTSSELLEKDANNQTRVVLMELRMNIPVRINSTIPIPFDQAGCELRGTLPSSGTACATPPQTDPSTAIQSQSTGAIPGISCAKSCFDESGRPEEADALRFANQMRTLQTWINTTIAATPTVATTQVLADYLDENVLTSDATRGFEIDMSDKTFDVRGVTDVKITLRGRLGDRRTESIRVIATPRNVPPLL
jgi:prepilin-type N-terminal cleavage/methylation domain-containing protein